MARNGNSTGIEYDPIFLTWIAYAELTNKTNSFIGWSSLSDPGRQTANALEIVGSEQSWLRHGVARFMF
jgi:hypothetical protein